MYQIPFDYDSIFQNRLIIITGVGRSGTTILGKLLGSMQPSYYLFEPTILKFFLPTLAQFSLRHIEFLKATLLEDYFLPLIQKRNINLNIEDDSCILHYRNSLTPWPNLSRRKDAIKYIKKEKPYFIIKTPEFQPLFGSAKQAFPGVKFIEIIRNGNDVICSAMRRGWYGNDFVVLDWAEDGAIWYIDSESKKHWQKWNPETRAACIWRWCCENIKGIVLRYEDLLDDPEKYILFLESWFLLKRTKITEKHIKAVEEYKSKQYNSILHKIQEPGKSKYIRLMNELGYEI